MTQPGSTTDATNGDQAPDATPTRRSLREARVREEARLLQEAEDAARSTAPSTVVTSTTATSTAVTSTTATSTAATSPVREQAAAPAGQQLATRQTRQPARTVTRATVARVGAPRSAAIATTSAASTAPRRPSAKKRRFLPVVVMTLTAGLLSTQVLPAIAAQQSVDQTDGSSQAAAAVTNLRSAESQSVSVSSVASLADTSRDAYTATAPAPKPVVTATTTVQTAAVQAARAQTAASYATYTGPTAADYVASPKYPSFSLDQVAAVGQQYIGTPYVFGGATPAGFDCSGFVMYVYAQFGISLAHSVPLQDAAGTRIATADAQPGDVVIFNNEAHDGFYMGNGMIMDAPKPGGAVSIRPIWTSDYHIVRFGIK